MQARPLLLLQQVPTSATVLILSLGWIWAAAHILGRSLLGQAKVGIQSCYSCIAINKKDDYRRAILKNAQQAFGEVMLGKEDAAAGKKRKQAAMHKLLTPCAKTSAESSSQKPGPEDLKNWMQRQGPILWKWYCFQYCCFLKFRSHDRGE